MTRKSSKSYYRVIFYNQGKVFEVYARSVSHGQLFGFLEVEDLIFGEKSALLVDPSEDALKKEFENTKRLFLPLHSVVRVDEMEKGADFRPRVVSLNQDVKKETEEPRITPIYTPPNPFTGK